MFHTRTIWHKDATVLPATAREMSYSMHVDDVAFGADSDDLAYELYVNSKTILVMELEHLL